MSVVTACVIIIGNEVLSGRTQDANLAFLARRLNAVGVRVMEARIVRDDEKAIVDAVNACRAAFDCVFTTGGIGPTHDDITAASVAKAFGVAIHRHPQAVQLLKRQYRPEDLNDARLKMADVPEGATLIDNPVSRAPGFRIGNVFVLPGVPTILRAMVDGLCPSLKGGEPVLSRSIAVFTREGNIAQLLAEAQRKHPRVEIGSYPFLRNDQLGVNLVLRSADRVALDRATEDVRALVRSAGLEPVEDPDGEGD